MATNAEHKCFGLERDREACRDASRVARGRGAPAVARALTLLADEIAAEIKGLDEIEESQRLIEREEDEA